MGDNALKELGTSDYWDRRYAMEVKSDETPNDSETSSRSHEWFRTFDQLRAFFEKHLPEHDRGVRILHLGCGTRWVIDNSLAAPRVTLRGLVSDGP